MRHITDVDDSIEVDGRVEAARLRLERAGRCPDCGRPAGECDEEHGQEQEEERNFEMYRPDG